MNINVILLKYSKIDSKLSGPMPYADPKAPYATPVIKFNQVIF